MRRRSPLFWFNVFALAVAVLILWAGGELIGGWKYLALAGWAVVAPALFLWLRK